ncbi:hypothetical protein K788_0009112 [Paraburkholderia caribensis MBA4]|uniref:Uncharacterized protein n=1 Tax=Paraburkholderia caribensis MBA4 TaxID=1323664 RepID=A0A0P0RE82_9BURK|nr:hypothetical protein K788_0009112 [Paraburkholderia caribensis MBA4]
MSRCGSVFWPLRRHPGCAFALHETPFVCLPFSLASAIR